MNNRFLRVVEYVLKHEGGYVNDPDDPGGETKFGISKRSFPILDIKSLTRNQAVAIYWGDYWKPEYDKINSEAIATKVFDLAVNTGHRTAHQRLQEAVNISMSETKLTMDGIIGPVTLSCLNRTRPMQVMTWFLVAMEKYYRSLNKPKFLDGWLNRLYDMEVKLA
ncbi:MAG: peptidoglycan-binding protein [Candidatus Dadabacteria bacterium]|nr:peptidoglycan-binding protein [Candidatus Dadabacteria bacterium]